MQSLFACGDAIVCTHAPNARTFVIAVSLALVACHGCLGSCPEQPFILSFCSLPCSRPDSISVGGIAVSSENRIRKQQSQWLSKYLLLYVLLWYLSLLLPSWVVVFVMAVAAIFLAVLIVVQVIVVSNFSFYLTLPYLSLQ